MLRLLILLLAMSAEVHAAWFFAGRREAHIARQTAFCATLLDDRDVTVVRRRGEGPLAFGDRVAIVRDGVAGLDANFIGRVRDRAFFTTRDLMHPSRTSFYLPADRVPTSSAITMDEAAEPFRCAPQSVMLCLDHLDRAGRLADIIRRRLHEKREVLFAELDEKLGMGNVERRPGFAELSRYAEAARTPREFRRRHQEVRLNTLRIFAADLGALGVHSAVTKSVWRLLRHLKRGGPAYVSVMGASFPVTRPHARDWLSTLPSDHVDTTIGTVPRPFFLAVPAMSHAVYAVGVLPPVRGLYGRLLGPRVVVLDPADGALNVWPSRMLSLSSERRFLLLDPR